jgi:tetratricopeptide (TPR) repeat protein
LESFLRAKARIMPPEERIVEWTDLPPIFERLVGNAPTPELKELSLWAAGECLMEAGHYNWDALPAGYKAQRRPLGWRRASRRLTDLSLPDFPEFFQRLVDEYPDSPLHAYARYRRAGTESLRLNPFDDRDVDSSFVELFNSLAAPFDKLDLQPGTRPHAWAKLDAGALYFEIEEVERAAERFEEVVETMPDSAEKAVAVLNLAKCRLLQADYPGARRLLSQLDGLPNFDCSENYKYFVADSYLSSRFLHDNFAADLDVIGQAIMGNIPALEQNQDFQKWRADRKRRPTPKSK